jgi:hypothetical protein
LIQHDWRCHNHKGYYITGRFNSALYCDDCVFTGPDPDLPIRGVRKYFNAASQLFDYRTSYAILLSIRVVPSISVDSVSTNSLFMRDEAAISPPPPTTTTTTVTTREKIVATWRMYGTIRLPWHPALPDWTGTTTYHRDERTGLICQHEETWDISVLEAFVRTLVPPWLLEKIQSCLSINK